QLDKYRTLWRNLTIDLYRTLPEAQKKATANPAARNVDEIKKTPRAQRKTVMIDSISSRFVDNLKAYATANDFERYAGGEAGTAPPTVDPNNPAAATADPTKLPNTNAALIQDNQRGY